MRKPISVRLVIFDWAGTIIDFGCQAPTGAFVTAFAAKGVTVTTAEARGPMGLHKKDHIRAMLQSPEVGKSWQAANRRKWTEDDVEDLYRLVTPLQVEAATRYGTLIPGTRKCVTDLRRRGVKIATTTGYFREAVNACYTVAEVQGFKPDYAICADEVPAGRPAPWMIFRAMEHLGAYPPATVVKVGDTIADIEEGRNAGVWSVGVLDTGNEMGLSHAEFSRHMPQDRMKLRGAVTKRLLAAGAHAVIKSVAELPELIDRINRKLASPHGRREPYSGR